MVDRVTKYPPVVVFPEHAGLLMAGALQVDRDAAASGTLTQGQINEMKVNRRFFDEYFKVAGTWQQYTETGITPSKESQLPEGGAQSQCESLETVPEIRDCTCGDEEPCIVLDGNRGRSFRNNQVSGAEPYLYVGLRNLYVADIVWLFYMERLGIFKILGQILDDYAVRGRLLLPRSGPEATVFESMVRQTRMGLASSTRDRDALYRRCLGWTSEAGKTLGARAELNPRFNDAFHKFIQAALEYYKDRRLATAIRGNQGGPASQMTLTSVSQTLIALKQAFATFEFGRNFNILLSGVVWAVGAVGAIRLARDGIGIPSTITTPERYIPAAYDILVLGKPMNLANASRFTMHLTCAEAGRSLLLDIERLNEGAANLNGPLDQWLGAVESEVEAYRTAYQHLTGVDLGAGPSPVIEQAVV
ncbi:MAG: hypothetical protein LC623_09270 [Halobacteriales archaeon]|nr:hypothetical protein [Halobacteriales archaeon]